MAHPVDVYVGNQIRRLRLAQGITQIKLAEQIGVKFQQLQKYETAANRISASRLYEVAQALGGDIHTFFPTPDAISTLAEDLNLEGQTLSGPES